MTPKEKQERQRQRRQRKRSIPLIEPELFITKVTETFDKLEYAFNKVAAENDPGRITIKRTQDGLTVSVKKVGDYSFTYDSGVQTLILQSP